MITCTKGMPEDTNAVIDFVNMVFSQNERPHDFKRLLPKLYGDEQAAGVIQYHYLVKEDGIIRAVVGVFPTEYIIGGRVLKIGQLGMVSVHPYARGFGYMKRLMHMAVEDSREKGYDALVLGGYRNRYEYFGFEPAEICLRYQFIKENITHGLTNIDADSIAFKLVKDANDNCLDMLYAMYGRDAVRVNRPRENFFNILKTWESWVWAIYDADRLIGYFCADKNKTQLRELVLEDAALFPRFLKAFGEVMDDSGFTYTSNAFNIEINEYLERYCECCTIVTGHSWNILNMRAVLSVFLELKQRICPLIDGEAVLEIMRQDKPDMAEERIRIRVENNRVTVDKAPEEASQCGRLIRLGHLEAVTFLYTQAGSYRSFGKNGGGLENWLPLPLYINGMDTC